MVNIRHGLNFSKFHHRVFEVLGHMIPPNTQPFSSGIEKAADKEADKDKNKATTKTNQSNPAHVHP